MITVHLPTAARKRQVATPVRRLSLQAFWSLFVVEVLLVVGLLLLVLYLVLPAQAPLAASADYAAVREAVWARVNGTVADPVIDVLPGVTARESSVRGFALNGSTYYYFFEGQRGFDPLSRGAVTLGQVDVVLRDNHGPAPLIIYRLKSKDRASD